jgi:hypothetical protein
MAERLKHPGAALIWLAAFFVITACGCAAAARDETQFLAIYDPRPEALLSRNPTAADGARYAFRDAWPAHQPTADLGEQTYSYELTFDRQGTHPGHDHYHRVYYERRQGRSNR